MAQLIIHKDKLIEPVAHPVDAAVIEKLLQDTPLQAVRLSYHVANWNWRDQHPVRSRAHGPNADNSRTPWIVRAQFDVAADPQWTISMFAVDKKNRIPVKDALINEGLPKLKTWVISKAQLEKFDPASHGGLRASLTISWRQTHLIYGEDRYGY
jgi:hypothetical protein